MPTPAVNSSTSPTQDGLIRAGDYHLKTLSIVTSDGKVVDISKIAVEINLYEDMFSPCMSGTVVMGEALDLVGQYKLHGNEFLTIEVDKPSLEKPIVKVFRIYKIGKRTFTTSNMQNYVIYFTSEEMILSTQMMLSKSYKGMTISNMVKDILEKRLGVSDTKRMGILTPTDGVFNIIIPRMHPFQAIQWLATRAYSATDSLYLFFENREGFNFVSFENLLKQPNYQRYFKNPKTGVDGQDNVNSVNHMEIVHDFDVIGSARQGAYSASLLTYDFISRQVANKVVTPQDFKLLNDTIPVNETKNRFNNTLVGSPDTMFKFYPTTDSDPMTNSATPEKWLQQKASKLAQLHSFKMVISVPGDVLIKVGMMVAVEIQDNETRTGRYLVSAVHHIFINDIMTTVMELLSDSVSGSWMAPINTSPAMQAMKKS